MSTQGYRPDIDGLRAVAVLLVVLFHAGLGFSGGFVGVDVFFVISGYLITGLIVRDIDAGTFRLSDFWTRRIRRIAPAALLMTLIVLVCGAAVLLPADFEELGESAIAHPLLVANAFFWHNTDYFDGPAELKPLLHTWSLAVEEQFYLLYPLLLMLVGRTSRRRLVTVLAVIAAASFGVSVWGVQQAPSAAFFLLPSRMWEMMLGGLLCFLPAGTRHPVRWKWVLQLTGLAVIGGVSWCYTAETPFPGWAALWPCLGAALVICAGGQTATGIGRLLASRPLVLMGRMSYSLYLWHWPILVFLRYRAGEDVSLLPRLGAVVGSVVAAYLSWRLVETPLRYGVFWERPRRVYVSFALATGLLVTVGVYVQKNDGLPERFGPELQRILADMQPPRFQRVVSLSDVAKNRLPEFGDTSGTIDCLIWGDSHAMALIPGLDESCRELGIHGYQATYGSTLPLVDFPCDRDGAAPEVYDEAVLDLILADEFDVVILAGYWSRDSDDPQFLPSVQETIAQLTAAGVRVVIMRDVPIQEDASGSLVVAPLRRGAMLQEAGITLEEHRRQQQAADAAFTLLSRSQVTVADPTPYFLDQARRCRIMLDGECLYSDRHHLSIAGSRRLKPLFSRLLGPLRSQVASSAGPSTATR